VQEKKLISQIEVLGRTIYIRERCLGLHGVEGHFISSDRLIEIEESLDDERKEEVLAHELLHVALEVSGLSSIFGEEWEEAMCLLIENVLKTYKTNFWEKEHGREEGRISTSGIQFDDNKEVRRNGDSDIVETSTV